MIALAIPLVALGVALIEQAHAVLTAVRALESTPAAREYYDDVRRIAHPKIPDLGTHHRAILRRGRLGALLCFVAAYYVATASPEAALSIIAPATMAGIAIGERLARTMDINREHWTKIEARFAARGAP